MARTRERKGPRPDIWPSYRYGPSGESGIFNGDHEVPFGWTKKPGQVFVAPNAPIVLDRIELQERLVAKGITPHPSWSARYMKELVDQ